MTGAQKTQSPGRDEIVLGIDVGGTKIHAAAFTRDLLPVVDVRQRTSTGGPSAVVNSVLETVSAIVDRLDGAPIGSIGIGIPGLIDAGRQSVRQAVNLGIGDAPARIGERIVDEFDVACTLENDVNAAAVGAFHLLNQERRVDDLAYLSIGTGIAAGVVLNRRLHRGHGGVAGEIGHFPMISDGPRCECGLNGCLEAVASGSAISRRWDRTDELDAGAALIRAAQSGVEDAMELLRTIADHLARAVHLLAITFDVEYVVLGGGVADIGEPLLEQIQSAIERLESRSPFVQALDLRRRLVHRPTTSTGVVGAAVVGITGGDLSDRALLGAT